MNPERIQKAIEHCNESIALHHQAIETLEKLKKGLVQKLLTENGTKAKGPFKFSRADYMEKRCTHAEYYRQFVTPSIVSEVVQRVGLKRLQSSTDPHLNDIPMMIWDSITCGLPAKDCTPWKLNGQNVRTLPQYQTPGDNSMSAGICIVKQAARMAIESENT